MDWLANPDPIQMICIMICGFAGWCFLSIIAFDLHRYVEARRVVHYRRRRMAQVEEALADEAQREEDFLKMLGA